MPNKIKPKRSYTTNLIPRSEDLEPNEIAINWADGKIYTKNAAGTVLSFAISAAGTSSSVYGSPQDLTAVSADYTLALADAGRLVTVTSSSAITITVPANATVAVPVGTRIDIARLGSGAVTIAGAAGVTVNATPGLKLRAQYSTGTLIKLAENTWLLAGDLSA